MLIPYLHIYYRYTFIKSLASNNMRYTPFVLITILMLSSILSSIITNAIADDNSNVSDGSYVYISYVEIVPSSLIVGDTFKIKAVVVNNSNTTITYRGLCESPISAEFDDHVIVEHVPACLGFTINELKPGESVEVTGPSSGVVYKAGSAGLVKAVVTFTYYVDSSVERASKEFTIAIDDRSVEVDEQFKLSIGQGARIRDGIDGIDLAIRLVDVLEDSRCAEGVYCVRAGSVTILLEVESIYGIMYLELAKGDRGPDIARIMNYTIMLIDVQPYPKVNERIEKDEYTVTLIASKSIPIEHGAIKAYSSDGEKVIVVWNEHSKRGFMISNSKLLRLSVEQSKCTNMNHDKCFNAIVVMEDDSSKAISIAIDYNDSMEMLVDGKTFMVKRMLMLFNDTSIEYSRVMIGKGEDDGYSSSSVDATLTVTHIDRSNGSVTAVNHYKYPVRGDRDVMLKLGDIISNGCTITLKLIGFKVDAEGIEEEIKAVFIKEVIDRDRCLMHKHYNKR